MPLMETSWPLAAPGADATAAARASTSDWELPADGDEDPRRLPTDRRRGIDAGVRGGGPGRSYKACQPRRPPPRISRLPLQTGFPQ